MSEKFKYIMQHVVYSVIVIIIIPIVAYFTDSKWMMFIVVPFLIIFIWLMAIMNWKTPVDKRAEEVVFEMFKKRQPEQRVVSVEEPKEEIKEEILMNKDDIKKLLKEIAQDKIDIPVPTPKDKFIMSIEEYKAETNNLLEAIKELEDGRKELQETHELKILSINKNIQILQEQRKSLKEKFLSELDL